MVCIISYKSSAKEATAITTSKSLRFSTVFFKAEGKHRAVVYGNRQLGGFSLHALHFLLCLREQRDRCLVERQLVLWFLFDITGVRRLDACSGIGLDPGCLSMGLWCCKVSTCILVHEIVHSTCPPSPEVCRVDKHSQLFMVPWYRTIFVQEWYMLCNRDSRTYQ